MGRLRDCLGLPKCVWTLLTMIAVCTTGAAAQESERIDYLSLAQGAIPVAFDGAAKELRVDFSHALRAIDGDPGLYGLTPAAGSADSKVVIVYKLPALTTFTEFAVPNILETPSPTQTFFKNVEIAGSAAGPQGPFEVLASRTLTVHPRRGQVTAIPASRQTPVRWVRLTLEGGLDIQRDKTFFEFSEIIGYGSQEPVPLSKAFSGKWRGRGVLLELKQDGVRVTGCYDGAGDLNGTVRGNLLYATGKHRTNGVPSTFVLTVGDTSEIIGVASTSNAPFRLYTGESAPDISTQCSEKPVQPLGCGSVVHGIQFDYDSAVIRPESDGVLNALAEGLKASTSSAITVAGHTSSEGSDAYNDDLSQRRAQAVVAALVTRGIDRSRVSAEGRGEKQPIADNATEAGRSLNRRVQIECR